MKHGPFPAVDDLIRQAEQAVANKPDPVRLVAELILLTGDRGADPYLLIGALIEGAARTLAKHIPPERHPVAAAATVRLLLDRLVTSGVNLP